MSNDSNRCDCQKEKTVGDKVVEKIVDTGVKMAVRYAVYAAVSAIAGPGAGYIAKTIVSGGEDLLS